MRIARISDTIRSWRRDARTIGSGASSPGMFPAKDTQYKPEIPLRVLRGEINHTPAILEHLDRGDRTDTDMKYFISGHFYQVTGKWEKIRPQRSLPCFRP